MFRRVVENVVVAVVASVVTWAISNPGNSTGAASAVMDRLLACLALYASPAYGWLWLAGFQQS
jgi:predicted membrane metal-binding protein